MQSFAGAMCSSPTFLFKTDYAVKVLSTIKETNIFSFSSNFFRNFINLWSIAELDSVLLQSIVLFII